MHNNDVIVPHIVMALIADLHNMNDTLKIV